MMNRKEFYEYVKDNVKAYLPKSYEEGEIKLQEVEKNNGLKLNFCILVRIWQILLYIVFDIFIKFFSVHHALLPLSDHVMVHSFSADHLLGFLLISHHSL